MKKTVFLILVGTLILTLACSKTYDADADSDGFTAPTELTRTINEAVLKELPFSDNSDFEEARRGLIASMPDMRVKDAKGASLWDMTAYAFITGEAPPSVNPSLWRQAKLNNIHGLFKVTEGIYQLRGFCLSNMTIIEGKKGWIIVDPLTTKETAANAIAFARKHLKSKSVTAIIYTHSHIDHFGGVLGVVSREDAKRNRVRVVAPKSFMEEATSENILAGIVMARRAEFQFGRGVPVSARGHVDTGLGKTTPFGAFGIIAPTEIVDGTPREITIDGVRFVFQYAPESEAPSEMTFYLPERKAFCGAEILSRTMHNLYTLRGTKARSALKWSGYIGEAMELFPGAEIYFGTHHWPVWGNGKIMNFMEKQRDLYRYIHDQTLRLANAGYTPREISEQMKLPKALGHFFSNRGYYGTLRHNVKAVYQYYLGWYDANPANLNPLPPEESAVRYVEFMGGEAVVLEKARKSFEKGEYRWAAEVLNHLVFARPSNREAKLLLARSYDQLGYQAESGVWRNVYLKAAFELRHGTTSKKVDMSAVYDILTESPPERFFDAMSVRLDGPKAEGKEMVLNVTFTDIGENHVLMLKNSVLRHRKAGPHPKADVTLRVTYDFFVRALTGKAGLTEAIFSDSLGVSGSRKDLLGFLLLFDKPVSNFNVVTP